MVVFPAGDQVLHGLCVIPVMGGQLPIQCVGGHNAVHVQVDAQTGSIRHLKASVPDLRRVVQQVLAVLPDPVGVQRGGGAHGGGPHLRKGGQCDIEVVVGMHAPRQPPAIQQLAHPDGAVKAPEMRVGKDDIAGVQADGVVELPPVVKASSY